MDGSGEGNTSRSFLPGEIIEVERGCEDRWALGKEVDVLDLSKSDRAQAEAMKTRGGRTAQWKSRS